MRGTILGVHDGRGVLSDADARRLEFPISEWRSAGSPAAGQVVDFIEDNGEARAVFAVPGAARAFTSAPIGTQSGSFLLGALAVGCLALGFLIPLLPTIGAFVLGIIGAQSAIREHDETALLLSRIGWIGALVMLAVGVIALAAVVTLLGGLVGVAHMFALGPIDF